MGAHTLRVAVCAPGIGRELLHRIHPDDAPGWPSDGRLHYWADCGAVAWLPTAGTPCPRWAHCPSCWPEIPNHHH